jgi:hypothetical protein
MNQVEKKYTVKRMVEIKEQKMLEIKQSKIEFTGPKLFTTEQAIKALKSKKYELNIPTQYTGHINSVIYTIVRPLGYTKKQEGYEYNTKQDRQRIEQKLAHLEKFCSDLSDKTMLGSDADALNALKAMTEYSI